LVILAHVRMAGTCYEASRDARHAARAEARAKQRGLAALARLGSNGPGAPGAEAAKGPATAFPHSRLSYRFTDQDLG
jgi:hypothetical protein